MKKTLPAFKTITFADSGQDFLEWVVKDDVVIDSQPHQFSIWVGREVLVFGRSAYMRTPETDHAFPLKYKVESVKDTDSAYVKGFMDFQIGVMDLQLYSTSDQYRWGYNTASAQPSVQAKPALVEPIKVVCRFRSGTYITNKVNGKQASNTAGADGAVRALGRKLLPDQEFAVTNVDSDNWLITPQQSKED